MIKQFYRQNTATSKVRNFNNENPPAGTVLPAASNSSSTYRNFFLSTPQTRSDDAVPSASSLSTPLHAVHFRHSSKFDAFVNFPEPHAVHARFAFCDPARETYVPAVQFAHALHSLSFDITENCPALHSAHTRSVPLVPSVATNFPPKQLLQSVHVAADRGENVPAPHAMQVLSLVAVPFAETLLPAAQLAIRLQACESAWGEK